MTNNNSLDFSPLSETTQRIQEMMYPIAETIQRFQEIIRPIAELASEYQLKINQQDNK